MRIAVILAVLAGCTWPSDFDGFSFEGLPRGVNDAGPVPGGFVQDDSGKNPSYFVDGGHLVAEDGGVPKPIVQDSDASTNDAAQALGDAGYPDDAGHTAPSDAATPRPDAALGPYSGSDLGPSSGYVLNADCQMLAFGAGTTFGFEDSKPSSVACPERLQVAEGFTITTRGYKHPTQNNGCEWIGPWGEFFTVDVDSQIYVFWGNNRKQVEVVYRGAICTYGL